MFLVTFFLEQIQRLSWDVSWHGCLVFFIDPIMRLSLAKSALILTSYYWLCFASFSIASVNLTTFSTKEYASTIMTHMPILFNVARVPYEDPHEDLYIDLMSYLSSWLNKYKWFEDVPWEMVICGITYLTMSFLFTLMRPLIWLDS